MGSVRDEVFLYTLRIWGLEIPHLHTGPNRYVFKYEAQYLVGA